MYPDGGLGKSNVASEKVDHGHVVNTVVIDATQGDKGVLRGLIGNDDGQLGRRRGQVVVRLPTTSQM